MLVSAEWSKLGEFSGMRSTIRRMMNGQSAQDAILACESVVASEPKLSGPEVSADEAAQSLFSDVALLIKAAKTGESLSIAWSRMKREWAVRIHEHLRSNGTVVSQMLGSAGIGSEAIERYRSQLKNLKRDAKPPPRNAAQS